MQTNSAAVGSWRKSKVYKRSLELVTETVNDEPIEIYARSFQWLDTPRVRGKRRPIKQ